MTKDAKKPFSRQMSGRFKAPNKPNTIRKPFHSNRPAVSPVAKKQAMAKNPLRITPLGGLNEIGKNMTCIEYGNDMFIIDCGLAFPEPDMLGVDIVLPDYSYVEQNIKKLRGIIITHGHEDHIGGVPYFLKRFNVPVYGTRLTIGLIEEKLQEHGLAKTANLNICVPRKIVKMGCMGVEMIRVNHSIPDAVGLAIHTPAGVVVHTGDFKVDYNPIQGEVIDLARFAELGNRGVLLLMSDSTNAERPGHTMPERIVGESFQKLFNEAGDRRIVVASFSSNIHRVQQIIDAAVKYDRKVAVSGRSMENVVEKAIELGYLRVPKGILISLDAMSRYSHDRLIVITTGSQGEPMSALARMASADHKKVSITSNDFIIISASPIPGNEKHVSNVVNSLMRLGAKVIYEKMYDVHTSGHACQDELKMMLSLTKPKYFIPVHGEYRHLKRHAELAESMGIPDENIIIGDIGQVIEISPRGIRLAGTVPSGQVFVDGLGVGDVSSIVIRDRKILAEDGLIVVAAVMNKQTRTLMSKPYLTSRGFIYVRESEKLLEEAQAKAHQALLQCQSNGVKDWSVIKMSLKDEVSSFIYRKTKRSPMIVPIIMEV